MTDKPTKIPSPLPTPFQSDFDVLIAANRKGGIGKTMMIVLLMACALMRNAVVRAFEIDQQSRLERMYPGVVQQINMPDSQELMDDELAEGRALARVYHALRSPKSEGLVFLDIGANYDERVAHGLLRARLSRAIAAAGRKVCVLVPLDGVSDTITAAASAIQQFTTALPDAHIVLVQRERKLQIDTSSSSKLSAEAKKAYIEVICPLHVPERTLTVGQMRKGVHKAFAALGLNPLKFMDALPQLLGEAATDAGADHLEKEFAGAEIQAYFDDFFGDFDEEVQRVLKFRAGEKPSGETK